MLKSRFVFIALFVMIFSFSAGITLAEGNSKQKSSPFLITGKMPHLTKLLMQQWDSAELQLTNEQKAELLVVRKETIGGVQQFGKEITVLENQIAEGSLNGKSPEELQSLVGQIERLKGAATMLHLRCIYKTRKILNQQQLAVLQK